MGEAEGTVVGQGADEPSAISRLFTRLIQVEVGLAIVLLLGEGFLSRETPGFVASYLRLLSPIPALAGGPWIALSLSLFLASRFLLIRRAGSGRHLLLLGVLLYAVSPSSGDLATYAGNLLAAFGLLIEGAIVALAFSRPVSEEFDHEVGEAPQATMAVTEDDAADAMLRRETWGFDVLLFAHLVLYFSWYFGTDLVLVDLPGDVEEYFEGLRFTDPWRSRMLAYWQVWEMFFLAATGFLFFRIDLGRRLYLLVVLALYLTPSGFFTPVSAMGSFLSYLQVLSHGAILALLFVGPVQREFLLVRTARTARR